MIDGKTSLYGILGWPVEHSLSPKLHNAAFKYWGMNARYVPLGVDPANQSGIIKALDTLNIKGANITVPYKSIILKQLDHLDSYAAKIDSVNTVLKTDRGWSGFSTDGTGFIKALVEMGITIAQSSFLLVGTGGAGKAIAFALCEAEASKLYLQNRSLPKALDLLKKLKQSNYQADLYETGSDFQVLINATSVGMDGRQMPVSSELIAKAEVVIDIIYSPLWTPMLVEAKRQGKAVQNGLPMLLNQAIASFKIWTGKQTPSEVLSGELSSAL